MWTQGEPAPPRTRQFLEIVNDLPRSIPLKCNPANNHGPTRVHVFTRLLFSGSCSPGNYSPRTHTTLRARWRTTREHFHRPDLLKLFALPSSVCLRCLACLPVSFLKTILKGFCVYFSVVLPFLPPLLILQPEQPRCFPMWPCVTWCAPSS